MTKREKALWLHEHYKNYSLKIADSFKDKEDVRDAGGT